MSKSKEELEELKKECENIRTVCNELNDKLSGLTEEELEKVTGGSNKDPEMHVGNCVFYGRVGKYEGVVGKRYFFVRDDGATWIHGKLTRTCEETFLFWSRRIHDIAPDYDKNGNHPGYPVQIYGDDWTIYEHMVTEK